MSMLDVIRDGFKYLDKNGLKHLIEKIKLHDVHWTGTHAEYEAQKDTIPAYAILHFTDDYDENVKVGIYSTEETKTGELFLNKPVYRKVFVDTIPAQAASKHVSTGFPAGMVDDIVDQKVSLMRTDMPTATKYWWTDTYVAGSSSAVQTVNVYLTNGGTSFYVENLGSWPATSRMIIILEYTKTTD